MVIVLPAMKTPPVVVTIGPVDALLLASMWTSPAVIAPAVRFVEPMLRDAGGTAPRRARLRNTVPAAVSCSVLVGTLALSVPAKKMSPAEEFRTTDGALTMAVVSL